MTEKLYNLMWSAIESSLKFLLHGSMSINDYKYVYYKYKAYVVKNSISMEISKY